MRTLFLYAALVLIWGSTWVAITYQLGEVAPEMSIAYRFGAASLLLFVYALLTGRSLALPTDRYYMVVVQGIFLFSGNYFLVYYASELITSGLIAVVFSLIVLANGAFERIFFGTPLEMRLVVAAGFGMVGIGLIFWPEISVLSLADQSVAGLLLAAASVVLASLGNMAAISNMGRATGLVALNAHAMAWGALFALMLGLGLGRPVNFSFQADYIASLVFLAVFGSAVAFACLLALIRTIGAARTGYASVLFPIVALTWSTWLEDYQWTTLAIAGIACAMVGNWLALTRLPQRSLDNDKTGDTSDG
ncbi:MAG: DMT family transporter [Gammaproteobacteria bacterium]|nr:DMT family transporter [Gammaproteobacteria bacterium]